MWLTTVALLALTQAAPPPIEQTTADCANPVYATDQYICADAVLSGQEREIADLWRAAKADFPQSPWFETQTAWFKRRAMCAFQTDQGACVRGANDERRRVLTALSFPNASSLQPATCSSEGRRASYSLMVGRDSVTAYEDGAPIWSAFTRTLAWTPFVTFSRGRSIQLRRMDGAKMMCRTAR